MNYFIAFHCHWKINAANIEGVTLVESRLEEVGSFGYKQGGTDTDVKVRMGKPRAAEHLELNNSNGELVFLYSAKSWRVCKDKIQTFINSCLRKILTS